MSSLTLSLAPPALVRLHDVLTCLAKFSDTVAIEAEHDLVWLVQSIIDGILANVMCAASPECSQLDQNGVRFLCLRERVILRSVLIQCSQERSVFERYCRRPILLPNSPQGTCLRKLEREPHLTIHPGAVVGLPRKSGPK